ncbi:MAG: FKBP-type peptidyl-prolyl cis-trans isomerase [Lachnospiraceae bacterium]|nr:FKBP-type peptidyl-prolyl cis-trans isomerase [Lachnospiraceae bacterium]
MLKYKIRRDTKVSSKENKALAKERRAKERKKKETVKKVKLGALILVVVLVVGALTYISVVEYKESKAQASASTETTDTSDSTTETTDSSDDSSSSKTLNTTEGTVVKEGDTVNIDYTGYLDGEAFDGGSTNGAGTDLELGSGTYIDGFEEQVEGHSVGETFDIEVTFPDDYGVDSLNGQTVTFNITINGVYE